MIYLNPKTRCLYADSMEELLFWSKKVSVGVNRFNDAIVPYFVLTNLQARNIAPYAQFIDDKNLEKIEQKFSKQNLGFAMPMAAIISILIVSNSPVWG